ncbi:MAG: helix-turn-helix domain-containing protein [Rhodobacterales bacterium]|nr:helix-turn-helix domain-containing protein [Rhodobacterales bacterium]
MLSLPLPILTFVLAIVVCGLVWRLELGNRLAQWFFVGVFVLIAAVTLVVGLRFGYGIERFIALQRVIPLFIGPFIYLGYVALMVPADQARRVATGHLGVAVLAAMVPQVFASARPYFDFVIGASYLIYGTLLVVMWRKGPNALINAKLDLVAVLRQWMLGSTALLAVTFVFDTGIAISFALRRGDAAVQLISYGSVISMISVVTAIVVFVRRPDSTRASGAVGLSGPPGRLSGDSVALEQAARQLLQENRLYLDTGLTLERLAKRLHVPARALSEAINKTQAMNVSQYVNGFRLEHAAGLLVAGDLTVTQIMGASGFLTRSNFYREFERVYARSPTQYRQQHGKT